MKKDTEKKTKESKLSKLKNKLVSKLKGLKKAVVKKTVSKVKVPKKKKVASSLFKNSPAPSEKVFDIHPLSPVKVAVEESKYYTGAVEAQSLKSALAELEHKQLPVRYNEDVLVLQIRDPWWAHVYWDVCSLTIDRLRGEFNADFDRSRWILRSYDVSYVNFDGTNAHRFFDTGVDVDARNWYLNLGSPGTSWCSDLGFILPNGKFVTVLRSNIISLPLDGPSWVTDEEWMIPDDEFRRLYGMSVGLGPNMSSPLGKLWQERLKNDITSKGIASMGVSSPVKKLKEKKGDFWLVVDTELIVYGATEPDAYVTVQGKPIKLRKDGTFTLRFALPDGKQVIPVEAKSAKIDEKRTITPIVTRSTERNP